MAFESTLSLAQLAEKELGHDLSTASSQRDDIVSWLDYGHKLILAGGDILNVDENGRQSDEDVVFNFARAATPKSVLLRPAISDASITATRASTTITFAAAPDGANSIAGFHIRIQGEPELYYVSAHTAAATTATILGGYVGPANVSATTCSIMKLRYDVGSSDVLRLLSPFQGFKSDSDDDRKVSLVDKEELYESCPPDLVLEGFPTVAGLVRENAGTYTVQFDSIVSDYELLELDYIAIPSTLDTTSVNPIIPAQFRNILSYFAAYLIGMRNNDSRSQAWLKQAQAMFRNLVAWDQNNVASTDANYSRIKISGFSDRKSWPPLVKKTYT